MQMTLERDMAPAPDLGAQQRARQTETVKALLGPTSEYAELYEYGQMLRFGAGSCYALSYVNAVELLALARYDVTGLIDRDDRQNNSPAMGEFLEMAQEAQGMDVLSFGGYRVCDARSDRRVSIDTVYLKSVSRDQGEAICANHFKSLLKEACPDEDDPCPELGDGWRRYWWD